MDLQFVYLPSFEEMMRGLLTDDEMRAIEAALLANPRLGVVIPHTNGVRKMRVALAGRGKRGGGRVANLYIQTRDRVSFIFAYAKNAQSDLTPVEMKAVAAPARILKGEQ